MWRRNARPPSFRARSRSGLVDWRLILSRSNDSSCSLKVGKPVIASEAKQSTLPLHVLETFDRGEAGLLRFARNDGGFEVRFLLRPRNLLCYPPAPTNIARKSLTLVSVGPVTT